MSKWTESDIRDWLEANYTLHRGFEISEQPAGWRLQLFRHGKPHLDPFWGKTKRHAIERAMDWQATASTPG